eukprot:8690510-Pyramimonas_sp.AAC.1
MPPKMSAARLSEVQPTPEELEAAKKILAGCNSSQRRSKLTCMAHFLKNNPDHKAESDRQAYLHYFIVHQLREKDVTKKSTSQYSQIDTTQKMKDFYEWSAEKMDQEMGPQKAKGLRDSGKIKWQACSHTGSVEDHMKEWLVPISWKRLAEVESTGRTVTAEGEATEDDFQHLQSMNSISAAGSSSGDVQIKQEPESEIDKLQKTINASLEKKETILKDAQDMEIDAKKVIAEAKKSEQEKYQEM